MAEFKTEIREALGKETLLEKVRGILQALKAADEKALAAYDIKDGWMDDETDDEHHVKKLFRYKATKDGYDSDVALFSVIVYWLAFCGGKEDWKIFPQETGSRKYCLKAAGVEYQLRGDTMNSYSTTIREFFRKWCLKNREKLSGKERVACIKGNTVYKGDPGKEWEGIFLSNWGFMTENHIFGGEAFSFLRTVHTIGNLIPVPFLGEQEGQINSPRGRGGSRDYWDLAMQCFYRFFVKEEGSESRFYTLNWLLKDQNNVELCQKWLRTFGETNGNPEDCWNAFLECNYLGVFTEGEELRPAPLWEDHFSLKVPVMPSENRFDQFYVKASGCIKERGTEIAAAVKNRLENEDPEALAKEMVGETD